jgi:peptidoglycan/xylan/chitin deacetylase (PgdA/CDA1 family)
MPSGRAGLAALGGGIAAAHLVPSVAAAAPLRHGLLPKLCGRTNGAHVALTFDDGPHAEATPKLLEVLAALDVQATFFVLGRHLAENPAALERMRADGHEFAVHGWTHRPHLLRTPQAIVADLRRASVAIADVAGARPRFWRPPNGIPTGTGLLAARRLGLRPVLWTDDARDWRADTTAQSIHARLSERVSAGAVVLLHDSDAYSAPGSWRAVLDAVPGLVEQWRARGWTVGPLREHLR